MALLRDHGTAASGYRLRTLCLFAALLAWLELASEFQAKKAMKEAFARDGELRRGLQDTLHG